MEKLKNLLSGHKNDETTSTEHNPHDGLSGEGSHLGSSTTAGAAGTSAGSGLTGARSEASTDQTGHGLTSSTGHGSGRELGSESTPTTGHTGGALAGQGSHFGGRDTTNASGYTGTQGSNVGTTSSTTGSSGSHLGRDAAVGAGGHGLPEHERGNQASSVVGGGPKTHLGSAQMGGASTTSGPHSSNIANKADPRIDSDNSRSVGTSGIGGVSTSGLSHGGSGAFQPQGTSSNMPGEWVDETTTPGVRGSTTQPSHSNNQASGLSQGLTSGHHTSNIANDADPRVDSDSSRLAGTSGVGSANSLTGAGNPTSGGLTGGSTASGPHSSNLANKADPRVDSDNSRLAGNSGYGSTDPASTSSNHHYGRDAAALGGAAAVGEGIHHHDQGVHSGVDTDSGIMGRSHPLGSSGPSHVASGPTSSTGITGNSSTSESTAYGGTGIDSSGYSGIQPSSGQLGSTTGSTAYGSRTGTTQPQSGSLARDVGAHGTSGQELPDRSVGSSTGVLGNREFPLSSGTTGQTGTTGSSAHHLGRDAAIGGAGVGAADLTAHEHNKHHTGTGATSGSGYTGTSSGSYHTGPTGSAVGPHATDTANLLDPNVSLGSSGSMREDAIKHDPKHGGGAEQADTHHQGDKARGYGSEKLPGADSIGVDTQNPSSHHHIGRDVGLAGAGAGAAGLAAHEHNNRQTGSSGPGYNSSTIGQTSTSNTSSHPESRTSGTDSTGQHHYGRDAGIAGAGAGLAAHEHNKHQTGSSSLGNSSTTGPGSSSATSSGPTTTSHTSSSGYPSSRTAGSDSSDKHHYGRDAGAGVGAAGLAEHEHNKHSATSGAEHNTPYSSSTTASSLPGPAPNTAGPHSKDWLNKLDPRVTANPTVAQGNPEATSVLAQSDKHHPSAGGSTSADSKAGTTSDKSGHHYGRDAAVTGGAGAGAYELGKHAERDEPSATSVGQPGTYKQPSEAPGLTGSNPNALGHPGASGITGNPYSTKDTTTSGSNIAHKGDPTTDKEHHHGRDAAVAGGAGAVGAGAYEASKHHDQKDLDTLRKEQDKQHKHDIKDAEKQHKHDVKDAEKQHKHDVKDAEKHEKDRKSSGGGLLGFLHRDKNKKYTQEEEDEFARQEREHNSSKNITGREAVTAGAAGGAGVGAYEAYKHHDGSSHDPTSTIGSSQGSGSGAGGHFGQSSGQSGLTTSSHQPTSTAGIAPHSHTSRDATLSGGAGAAGVGAYEAEKHHGHHTTSSNAPTTAVSGQPGHNTTGQPTVGFGSGTGTGPHLSEASTDQDGNPLPGAMTDKTGTHNIGRDAAIGGAGTGGLGAGYEAEKHHHSGQQSGSRYNDQTAAPGYSGTHHQNAAQSGSQTGSGYYGDMDKPSVAVPATGYGDTSGATNATGGYDDPSYRSSGQTVTTSHPGSSGLRDSNTDSKYAGQAGGLTGSDQYTSGAAQGSSYESGVNTASTGLGHGKVSDATGRNRLHKDPPNGHPAAQSGVPASGSETSRLVKEGEETIHGDTGVAGSHGVQGGNVNQSY